MTPRDPVLVRALDALEDGDPEFAAELLEQVQPAPAHGVRCDECGRWFEWAGLRDDHVLSGLCPGGSRSRDTA